MQCNILKYFRPESIKCSCHASFCRNTSYPCYCNVTQYLENILVRALASRRCEAVGLPARALQHLAEAQDALRAAVREAYRPQDRLCHIRRAPTFALTSDSPGANIALPSFKHINFMNLSRAK